MTILQFFSDILSAETDSEKLEVIGNLSKRQKDNLILALLKLVEGRDDLEIEDLAIDDVDHQ
jgi:hypothetical protein